MQDLHFAVCNGDDCMTHDNLKKAYVCAMPIGNDVCRVRIATALGPDGQAELVAVPVPIGDMTRLVETDKTQYFVMSNVFDLLTEALPPGVVPCPADYGVEIVT